MSCASLRCAECGAPAYKTAHQRLRQILGVLLLFVQIFCARSMLRIRPACGGYFIRRRALYDAFDDLDAEPPCAYIVQEYIRGETLASLMKAGHRFSIDRVYDIVIQLLKIIQQLHSHTPPIIHRDIKPSNILLQPS